MSNRTAADELPTTAARAPHPGGPAPVGVRVESWESAQAASDALWSVIRPAALYQRPVPERHRLIFYLGHLEAFDWNLLAPALGLQPFHAEWDRLFAFGIDPVGGELPRDQPSDWPAESEVAHYGATARRQLDDALRAAAREDPDSDSDLTTRLQVAIEHRWMHVETLSYLFHNLPYDQKQPPAPAPASAAAAAHGRSTAILVPAGPVTLGRVRDGSFGWDNEFEAHRVEVPALRADRYKVSNGDYLRFVQAGAQPPHFWQRDGEQWNYRGMFALQPLPLDAPVYVTHDEASAYAAWKGQSLPTEAEWQRLAYATPDGGERAYPWGESEPGSEHGNFDFRHWDPVPVGAHPAGASAWGLEDLIGNGWEWTSTRFGPFPGFAPMPFYPGYSANFFDGQHYVLKGASPRTSRTLVRRSFRNWFQTRYPYLYAGFRCVTRP